MKKKIILVSIVIVCFIINSHAQNVVPNGNFEIWNNLSYEDPTGTVTANGDMVRRYNSNLSFLVTKSTDKHSGNFAVKLETKVIEGDTSFGYCVFGQTAEEGPGGGFPYTQKPDSIVGWYKSGIVSGDSALILVWFKKNGVNVLEKSFFIKGTQSSYKRFSFPLNIPAATIIDTVLIGFVSSDPFTEGAAKPGSWLLLDDITFVGSGITQQVSNTNFENWTSSSVEIPDTWLTYFDDNLLPHVKKTSDKYKGQFAATITTKYYDIDDNLSMTFNGRYTQNGPIGGSPFNNQIDTLFGYYKYQPQGQDSASIHLNFKKNGNSLMGGNGTLLLPTNVYTYFEIPINLMQQPDTIFIYINSSEWPVEQSNNGSKLTIDELQFKSNPINTYINNQVKNSFYNLFPNPVKDILNIEFNSDINQNIDISILDISGKIISNNEFYAKEGINIFKFNTENLSKGFYTINMKNSNNFIRNFKFIVR